MKKSIAKKWVNALRSGDYEQGKLQLRSINNKFCCLGVLCNIHAQEHPEFAAKQLTKIKYDGASSITPKIVQEWAGLKTRVGAIPNSCSLLVMNDNGMNFHQIADEIVENWKVL